MKASSSDTAQPGGFVTCCSGLLAASGATVGSHAVSQLCSALAPRWHGSSIQSQNLVQHAGGRCWGQWAGRGAAAGCGATGSSDFSFKAAVRRRLSLQSWWQPVACGASRARGKRWEAFCSISSKPSFIWEALKTFFALRCLIFSLRTGLNWI